MRGELAQVRLGHVETAILDLLNNHPQLPLPLIVMVHCNLRDDIPPGSGVPRAVYESCRRAAHRLEEKGLVILRYGLSPFGPRTLYVIHAEKGQALRHLDEQRFDGVWSALTVEQAVLDFLQEAGPVPYLVLRRRIHERFTGHLWFTWRGQTALTRAAKALEARGKIRFWRVGRTRSDWIIGLPHHEPYIPEGLWPDVVS